MARPIRTLALREGLELRSVPGSSHVGIKWLLVLAVGVALSVPSAAEAHFLSLARARAGLLEFAYGVAYSYPISRPPIVRCVRRNAHSADCDWSFVRTDALTVSASPAVSPAALCVGRYRVFFAATTNEVRRAVVRRLTCRGLP